MSSSTKIIGLIGNATQEVSNRTLSGMVRYTQEVGGLLIRDFRMPSTPQMNTRSPPPWSGRADGVVVAWGRLPNTTDRETATWLLSAKVPVVSVSRDWNDRRVPSVSVDPVALGRMAAEHLVECECKSFLFVGYRHAPSGSRERYQALARALAHHGFKLKFVAQATPQFDAATTPEKLLEEKSLVQALRRGKKPLGVCVLNDMFARGICSLCQQLGLAVPGQVKILGTDDLMTARSQNPTLSTLQTPREEMGYLALQVLDRILRGETWTKRFVGLAPTELAARASTRGGATVDPDLQETLKYIARYACQNLTVAHLAQRLHISRRSLELNFRTLVGISPGQEIQRVRLERAKELLWKTQLSVKYIAGLTGFFESTSFCKFFKHEVGLTPLEYREALNSN